jgi:hypothetical protein
MSKQIKTSEKIANSVFGYCVCLDMMRLAADNLGDIHTSDQNRLATVANNKLMDFIKSKQNTEHKGV